MAPNQPRPTKAQRREAARAQAKAAREKHLRQERRRTITRRSLIGASGLAVAGAAGYVVYNYLQGRDNRPVKEPTAADFPSPGTVATAKADRQGVPEPVLSDGSWTYGAKAEPGAVTPGAPVLDIFFDYSCHHCADFEVAHAKEISTLLSEGKVTLVLHSAKALGQSWTDQVMNAMGVVLSKAPEQSLAFHTAVMEHYASAFAAQNNSALTTESIVEAATKAKVPSEVSEEIEDAIKDNTYEQWLKLSQEAMQAAGVTQTPTVFLDGRKLDVGTLGSDTAITEQVEKLASESSTPGQ